MPRDLDRQATSKSKGLVYLEYVLLAVCLCSLALRTTLTEGPAMQSTSLGANLGDSLYSLSVSSILILSFVLWVVWSLWSGRFLYRPAGLEIGLGILCIGAVAAGLAAADKRLALTDVAMLVAPPLTALLLVQILDCRSKIRLVLIVIAALGLVSAYQCADQIFFSNRMTIEQYQKDPQSLLAPLGIEPGSFQQFMFEHRLYSGGARGFFTTRNSAGSFALCAFFAALVLFLDKLKNRTSDWPSRLYLSGCGLAATVILLSLALTRSKGAVAGLLFAGAAFAVLCRFGSRLRPYRTVILVACVLLAVAIGSALAAYGLSHGRLPGGNSMLVRWQYWHASAKMYADHPLIGVGPGNFSHFYPRYKPAAALESVADPHNFALSLLTQYGPLGLAGFLAMIFVPLWRMLSTEPASASTKDGRSQPPFRMLATIFLIIISAALLAIRPVLMPMDLGETLDVIIYVILTLYAAPAAVFILGFIVLAGPLRESSDARNDVRDMHTAAALSCAVLGVALHNLTDFAIFEPGVATTFWATIACIAAIDAHTKQRAPLVRTPAPFVKALAVAAALAASLVYLSYVFIPAAKSAARIGLANEAISAARWEPAHELLEQAGKDDRLSAAAWSLDGRLYQHQFELAQSKNPEPLLRAAECLRTAIERNNAAFKDFERLADVYCALAEVSRQQERADWLNKAFDAASLAIERYPGSDRLHFKLAQIAEQLGRTAVAVEQYKEAVRIEDKYRAQFRRMYPERKDVVSRLGKGEYNLAKDKLKSLPQQKAP